MGVDWMRGLLPRIEHLRVSSHGYAGRYPRERPRKSGVNAMVRLFILRCILPSCPHLTLNQRQERQEKSENHSA